MIGAFVSTSIFPDLSILRKNGLLIVHKLQLVLFVRFFFCHRYMLLSSVDNFNIGMVHKRKYTYGARLFHSMCYYFHFVHTNIPCCPFKYSLPQIFEWYMPLRYGVEYSSPLINLPFLLSSVSVYFFNVLPSKL